MLILILTVENSIWESGFYRKSDCTEEATMFITVTPQLQNEPEKYKTFPEILKLSNYAM